MAPLDVSKLPDFDSNPPSSPTSGGPGGLALANALRRRAPKLSFQVFERAPSVPERGAGVALYTNGAAALRGIDPALLDRMTRTGWDGELFTEAISLKDEVLASNVVQLGENKPAGQHMEALLPWYEMTTTLAQALPEGTVSHSKVFSTLSLDADGGALVGFEDGSSYNAKVVIGCDGFLSPVRRAWLHDELPAFTGNVTVRGRVATSELRKSPGWDKANTKWYSLGEGVSAMVYSINKEVGVWSLKLSFEKAKELGLQYEPGNGSMPRVSSAMVAADKTGPAVHKQTLTLLETAAMPATLLHAVARSDPESCMITGDYAQPVAAIPDHELGSGPVTVLGDAFHPMPALGQGANMAFEDALVLAHYLATEGPVEEALRAYEADRLPRAKRILEYMLEAISAVVAASAEEKSAVRARYPEYNPAIHTFDHACLR